MLRVNVIITGRCLELGRRTKIIGFWECKMEKQNFMLPCPQLLKCVEQCVTELRHFNLISPMHFFCIVCEEGFNLGIIDLRPLSKHIHISDSRHILTRHVVLN